jgi:AraC-like DNA-binding protein
VRRRRTTLAELYVKARAIVERHYRRPLTLPLVARTLAASPRQLERAYDEIGLTTFTAHLRAVRMRKAAELLAHQSLTVTDVARPVGYRQPSHVVSAFRRRYETTPGAFRDRAQALHHSRSHVAGPKGLRTGPCHLRVAWKATAPGGAPASPPMQERWEGRSRPGGRLLLVHLASRGLDQHRARSWGLR